MDSIIYQLFNLDIAEIGGFISAPFRWLGWNIIKICVEICNSVEDGVRSLYTINDFFDSQSIKNFIDRYKPIFWALLGLALAIIFVKIIVNRQENRSQIPMNVLFSIMVLLMLPTVMLKLNDIGEDFYKDVNSIEVNGSASTSADKIVKSNLWDLSYIDRLISENKGLDISKIKDKNTIPDKNILNIDINQEFNSEDTKSKNVFNKKVISEDGKNDIVDLDDGFLGIGKDFYYQFNLDFVSTFIALGATAITLVCVCLKIARILFDLAFNKVFAMFIALFDVADGKKLRAILKHILAMFIVLMVTAVTLHLYILFNTWIGTKVGNGMLKAIVLVGVSLGVINGPSIVERIIGEDAGVKNGMNTMLGAYGAIRSAKDIAGGIKSVIGGASNIGGKMATAGVFGAGMLGLGNNNKPTLNDEMKEANSGNGKAGSSSSGKNSLSDEMKKAKGEEGTGKDNLGDKNNIEPNNKTNLSDDMDKEKEGKNLDLDKKKEPSSLSDEMKKAKGEGGIDKNKLEPNNKSSLNDDMDKEKGNKNLNSDKKKETSSLGDEMKKAKGSLNDVNERDSNIPNKDMSSKSTPLKNEMNDIGEQDNNTIKTEENQEFNKNKPVTGKLEDRTIGQYMKDGIKTNKTYDRLNRAYSLGENTRKNWNVKRGNKIERKLEKKNKK